MLRSLSQPANLALFGRCRSVLQVYMTSTRTRLWASRDARNHFSFDTTDLERPQESRRKDNSTAA